MANQDDNKPGSNPSSKADRSAPKRKPVTIEGEAKSVSKPDTKSTAKPSASGSVPPTKSGASEKAVQASTGPTKNSKPSTEKSSSGKPLSGKSAATNLGRAGADAKAQSFKQSSGPSAGKPASSKPAAPVAAKDPKKTGGGTGSGLIGGLAGGALVALLAGGWGFVSGTGTDAGAGLDNLRAENAALVERLAQVEATQADMGDADPDAELVERVNALAAQLQALPSDGSTEVDLAPVTDRITELEAVLAETQSSAQSAVQTATALQSQVESGGSGDAPALAAQSSRLDELSDAVNALGGQLDELAGQAAQSSDVEPTDLAPVNSQLEALSNQMAQQLEQTSSSLDELSASVSNNATGLDGVLSQISDVQSAVASLSAAMEDAQSSLAASDDEQQVARAALAAATLAATIDGGKPFVAELDNFAAVTSGSDSLASGAQAAEVLRPFAETGVPTVATLQAEWPPVAQAVIDSVRPAPETMGDKFVSNLRGLVSVRPAGDVGGDGPRAVVGRMTTALDEAQLSRFQALQAELPEAGQAASAAFAARVVARNEANSLLTSVLAGDAQSSASSTEGTPQ